MTDPTDSSTSYRSKLPKAVWFAFLITVVIGMTAAPILAGPGITSELSTSDWDDPNTAPNPVYEEHNMTVARHPGSEGYSDEAMSGYYEDNGTWINGTDSGLVVNDTMSEVDGANTSVYFYKPGHIDDDSYTAFPDKSDRTWTNASRWNSSHSNVTLSNTSVNSGADGVQFQFSSSGDTTANTVIGTANFSAWDSELDTDEGKRYLQFAADVDTLQTAARVQVRIFDESGDYKQVVMNDSRTFSSNGTVLADGTNDVVRQVQLNTLTTHGGGSFDNIENVTVQVTSDANDASSDATFTISWLDLRRKTKVDFGEVKVDTGVDTDSHLDQVNQTHNSSGGKIGVHDMTTLDNEFDDATINDVEFDAWWYASDMAVKEGNDEDYRLEWEDASQDYPDFPNLLNVTYRIEVPEPVDITHGANQEIRMTQKWPSGRYEVLGIHEDMGGANFSEVSYTDKTGNLSSKESEITLDASAASSNEYGVKFEMTFTESQRDTVEAAMATGAAPAEEGDGGFLSTIEGKIIAILGGLGVFALVRRVSGRFGG